MSIQQIIKQGKKPVFHFICPLCGHEWNEYYLEGSSMLVTEVDVLKTRNTNTRTFQAKSQCPCCGLYVWSDKIAVGEEEKRQSDSPTRCETCKNYESNSDITGWCSACPGTVTKGMNSKGTCAAYEKREEDHD